ncbi:MAG: type IV pili methyl-accepting chemotaxis transducer N-terminal domain-containing protein [Planctomycetota bacterium]
MTSLRTGAATAAFCLGVASLAAAEPTAEEWARVLNLSGRQRMLTQKMSKEALFVTASVNADKLRGDLSGTTKMFEETLAALRDGDAALGLPATENPRIVKQLDKVRDMYEELKPVFETVISGGVLSSDQMTVLAAKNVPLLKEMNKAVKMYERGAKKSSLSGDASAAVVINLAGKQRMLTQKMSKEALLVELGVDRQDNLLNLRETTALFDRTLSGLLDGDSDLELPGTDDTAIRVQLTVVSNLWGDLAPMFDGVLSGRALSADDLATLSVDNVSLLKEMNKGVKMFEQAAN